MPRATIYYHPEGYNTNAQRLMGRHAAGEGFLRAAAQSGADRLHCHADSAASAGHFSEQLAKHGFRGQSGWVPLDRPAGIGEDGCLFLPGPNLGDSAWQRAPVGERTYSLCGITHTTASHLAMSSITDLLVAPVRSWDALICTSLAVRDTVRHLLESQANHLRGRLGATRFELPQFPVIPLGVHASDFAFTDNDKAAARTALGIAPDEVVFLFVGRLAFHAKAHPQQMFAALERASEGRRLRLVQCGWYGNEHIEAAFNDAAKALSPSITLQHVDGRDTAARRHAWACADIFMSLSDNIQETFGLTPIEAMAAGLPLIVTDWDGYKDTVRDGVDGFRIPTLTPPAGYGADLAQRYAIGIDTYDVYCGLASQLTAVDPQALLQACRRLIGDPELRRQMGAAGRERARQSYDWPVIYRRYQTLWEELAERRRADPDLHPPLNSTARPDRPDPFAAFAGYATSQLTDNHVVTLLAGARLLEAHRALALNSFAAAIQPTAEDCATIAEFLRLNGPQKAGVIAGQFPVEQRLRVVRGLVWMAKMDAIRIDAPGGAGNAI
jgi:glycosyltransferase involved in cell wall biosynthesis